ncbi:hypothetical protein [Hymenobacter metallilatus]|uniref:Glycerophosphoryl diester phosphodiesterase membrane domain-containing protein n=1 Tax=Hymenobacter metallilatus TaxID=2493666 RepID=A0A428IZ75_9BACT|nr:hypothetical protein [Hymenobacter metallilatus]RSK24335.1 hypothetical protein EI290_20215 [Hymenobacter metallilatus]
MQQKFTQESDFRQERDFGQKIGATFEFLAAHWKPLGKCLLYFVLPAAILTGLGMGLAQTQLFGGSTAARIGSGRFSTFSYMGPAYWFGLLASLIGYILLGATVYGYLRARIETPAEETVTPRQVGQFVARYSPPLLLSSIVTIIIVVFASMLLVVPGIYLGVALSLVWAVQVLEDGDLGFSLRRSVNLINHKWWSTLGLTFVVSLIIGMLGIVFQIPQYVAIFGKAMHWEFLSSDVLLVAGGIFAAMGNLLLYSILMVALAFQYFNLVEKKDGFGLRQMVQTLGSSPAPVVHNAAFRPDDEGEY